MHNQEPPRSRVAEVDRPRMWWRIADSHEPSQLPFLGFYEELACSAESNALEVEIEEEIMQTLRRVADPVVDWQPKQTTWGEDHAFIEDWFDAGEALAEQPQPYECQREQADALDRALRWMRSVAKATGLINSQ